MPKTKFFSRKDGTTFIEDVKNLAEHAVTFIKGLPAKIKALLPEAEDFVRAVQALSDAVKDGQPADVAIDLALSYIPGTADEDFYAKAKHALEALAIRLQILIDQANDITNAWGSAKRETATGLVLEWNDGNPEPIEAGLAVETAVYLVKAA